MRMSRPALVALGTLISISCSSNPELGFVSPVDAGNDAVWRDSAAGSTGSGGAIIVVEDSSVSRDADQPESEAATVTAVCGDGFLTATVGEECDDGNLTPGDGCGATCKLEVGWICPVPGEPCRETQKCGDGTVTGSEQCDDANTSAGDGCDATCQVEAGWTCPTAGSRCLAAACGDGIQVGSEQCDDGNSDSNDGCSATCAVEHGFFCPTAGSPCKATVCGNGTREGDEACDDGNTRPWDGCASDCQLEPTCTAGVCHSVCGDGMTLSGDSEACDDGNSNDGDGCSKDCQVENGWECKVATETDPTELVLPVVYRDFIALPATGNTRHPNFEDDIGAGLSLGLVKSTLGADGKPVYAGICDNASTTGCAHGRQLTTQADFDQWYRDTDVSVRGDSTIRLTRSGGQYVYDAGSAFLPFGRAGSDLANVGWVVKGDELAYTGAGAANGGDFGFTTELHYWFQLHGDEHLEFAGDDDVWVFLKNDLIIDLGGRHSAQTGSIDLTDDEIATRGLEKNRIYEIAFFHAERHTVESNFKLTLNNFVRSTTSCTSVCGDGIVVAGEVCDDGALNGTYGHCNSTCTGLGPRCGDGEVQPDEGEQCDDGVNLSTYGINGKARCAPGCKLSPYCGDGQVDSLFGEQCDSGGEKTDAGTTDGSAADSGLSNSSDGCQANCTFRKLCGNGIIDSADGETCDDGNTVSGDGCSEFCTTEQVH